MDAFNIAEKLFCITADNASNNKKAMKSLTKLLLVRKGIKWNWKEYYISCLNHVIDLAVQAFLKKIKVIEVTETEEEEEDNDEGEDIDESDSDQDEDVKEKENDDEDLSMPRALAEKMTACVSEFQAII